MTTLATRFDAATLEILWGRLHGIADEMFLAIGRTSFSTIVSAALDYGCAILDAEGGQLVHAAGSMPLFNLALPRVTQDVLRRYAGRIHPGDVFIGNDPWLCCGHLPDVAIMTPIFHADRLGAFTTSVAHQADFGGAHGHNRVREVYEEGLFIPAMKLYERGERNPTLFEIISANVRAPDLVLGDIEAQVAANEVGARRVIQLLDEYALDDPSALVAELQGRSEQAMREIIRGLPDGTYRAQAWSDSKGHPTRIEVAVTIAGDQVIVDYAGTADQLEQGGLNCTLAFTVGQSQYDLKCILAPTIPHNEGSTRPIEITAPAGSILNCTFPASVNARVYSYHHALHLALAPLAPGRAMAEPGLYTFPRVVGVYPDGKAFDAPIFAGGGQGGSDGRDGMGGFIYPSSASNVSIELFEAACPAIILRKEWVPDSGGAGQFRGGPAARIVVRRLPGYERPVRMRYFPIRAAVKPAGMLGGHAGTIDVPLWNGKGVPPDHEIARDGWTTFRTDQDELTFDAPAGAGYGDPKGRDPKAIEADIRAGLVTRDGAARDYGYQARPEA
jgi:N-methylhydantoinase B/oxoprolinase/acetone carboxylase alpha subunit